MHGKSVIILLIYFTITCLQTNHLVNSLVSEKNFFYTLHTQLNILTNKILKTLNLGPEFTETSKTQRLLSLLSYVNNTAEKHNVICDDILKAAKATFKVNYTYGLEKIFEDIISDIIKEETDKLKNDKIENSGKYTTSAKLSVPGIVAVSNDIQRNKDKKLTASQQKTPDVKVWQPLISNEDIVIVNGTRRIYMGKKTRIKKYPFLVSIHIMNEFMCAGSIISKDMVITAATCLHIAYNNSRDHENPRSIFARVGSDYAKNLGQLIPINKLFFHPGFDSETLKNNIAIVQMEKRLKFSKKRKTQRIHYDRNGDILADNVNSVTILGWGARHTNGEPSETQKLSVARLDIYDIDECKDIYSRIYVTDKNFCAGFVSQGGGACNRDVGGPGIVAGELVGIISFGPLFCGMSDAPTVFTKLGFYADWIYEIINLKPQMRIANSTQMTSKTTLEVFPKPLLTTTGSTFTEKLDLYTVTTESMKNNEVLILKEMLQETLLSNNSIIDYILYGDIPINDNAVKNLQTTKKNMHHHPLSHKSIKTESRTQVVEDNSRSNYENEDIGVKILESLVGYKQDSKTTTAKFRFEVKGNKDLEHKTTANIINNLEHTKTPHLDIDQENEQETYTKDFENETNKKLQNIKPDYEKNPESRQYAQSDNKIKSNEGLRITKKYF